MFLITTVQGYLKPCSKQLKFSVTLYPPLPYEYDYFAFLTSDFSKFLSTITPGLLSKVMLG